MNIPNSSLPSKGALLKLLIAVLLSLSLSACGDNNHGERRNLHLTRLSEKKPVKLAVVWSRAYGDSYFKGAQIAVDEANAAGGAAGHPIELVHVNAFTTLEEGRQAVYSLSGDMSIAFALGLYKSEIAAGLVGLLQYYGLPMLTNANVDDILKKQWTNGVFRGVNTSTRIGTVLYEECVRQGIENVLVCYGNESYTESVADVMISLLQDNSKISTQIYRMDALSEELRFKLKEARDTSTLKNPKTAAVLLINDSESVSELLPFLVSECGVEMVFTSNEIFLMDLESNESLSRQLDIPLFVVAEMADAALAEKASTPALSSMIAKFEKTHGHPPDIMAVYGYDQAGAVISAIREAGSAAPDNLTRALGAGSHEGLMQTYAFTDDGELKAPKMYLIDVTGGRVSISPR